MPGRSSFSLSRTPCMRLCRSWTCKSLLYRCRRWCLHIPCRKLQYYSIQNDNNIAAQWKRKHSFTESKTFDKLDMKMNNQENWETNVLCKVAQKCTFNCKCLYRLFPEVITAIAFWCFLRCFCCFARRTVLARCLFSCVLVLAHGTLYTVTVRFIISSNTIWKQRKQWLFKPFQLVSVPLSQPCLFSFHWNYLIAR